MKKIFIEDSCFSHCVYSNNPMPPIQFSDKIIWDRTGSFSENDFVIYTDQHITRTRGNPSKDIAWLIEPRELQPENYKFLEEYSESFFRIFTHDELLLRLPNAVLIPYGGCWIKKENFAVYPKNKNISIICSGKSFLSGHRLRHECIKTFSEKIDVFGNGYNPIDSKLEALSNYRFQIVIENSKTDFWFTEKLIDCFVTGTVPIYYGCPSIGKFFDINGIITFNSLEELDDILCSSNETVYLEKTKSIEENFQLAKNYLLAEDSIFKELEVYG